MINTSAYSFAAQAFEKHVAKYVSLFEGFVGIGCAIGPVLGSFVYAQLGFEKTFFIFGGLMAPSAFMVALFVPSPKKIREKEAE